MRSNMLRYAYEMDRGNADPVRLLLHGILVLGRRIRSERPPGSLSLSALAMLGALNRMGPTAATRLAAEERLQPQSLTRLISELEQRRLIFRKRSHDDRRVITIAISARGRRVLLDDIAARRDWLETALQTLQPAERRVLFAASAVMVKLASHESFTREDTE